MASHDAPCMAESLAPSPGKRRRVSAAEEEEEAAHWAARLQEQEDAESARRLAFSETRRASASVLLDALIDQENERRVACEGPPCPPELRLLVASDGIEERLQGGGRPWEAARACVTCDDAAVLQQLADIGVAQVVCPGNRALLRRLCAWRKHILETALDSRRKGATKWNRRGICTSLQTWLGAKQGVLCHVATAPGPISTLRGFVDAFPRDARQRPGCTLSAGRAMLCVLYFDWPLDASCKEALQELLKKRGKRYCEPWSWVFAAIIHQGRVDDRLKRLVLSRAHLP